MIEIKLRPKESELKKLPGGTGYETRGIDKALLRLRKKMDREKVMDEVKERKHYVKPSEKRKLAKNKAVYRQKCREIENQ